QRRLKAEKPIHLHEFLYPVAQAIDCIEMDVDLEIGGSDQTFNMLCGRTLMKALKDKEKFVLTTKLLVDSKGEKVGKTAGNALFLDASPNDMYGGIMSFPDEAIIPGFELLTMVPMTEIKDLGNQMKSGKTNHMGLKKKLAREVVALLYSEKEAKSAQEEFERVFQKGKAPIYDILIYDIKGGLKNIVDLLVETKLAPSRSEAKRLVEQGAVEVDGKPITNYQLPITIKDGMIIKVGKRKFLKISANQ
ncbi:tyrosine--tRNA ligase, partial [Candidatus Shapirobacteria bacterium CG10_big_fil_rev_8_21_14_0_10_40_9]